MVGNDLENFYQVSQGSQVIDYDIFLSLEVADGQDLFRSDATSARYGLIPQTPNPRTNPDGLAIGLTKTVVEQGRWKGNIGLSCAACHTAQLNYQGRHIRIDGGVANAFDLMGYIYALDDALQATSATPRNWIQPPGGWGASTLAAKEVLRDRFARDAERVHAYRTGTLVTPAAWGPARMDAVSLIVNRLIAIAPGLPELVYTAGTNQTAVPLELTARAMDAMARFDAGSGPANLPETMGVFMPVDLQSRSPQEGLFDSSAAILNLREIETKLRRCAPPQWPEEILGRIDRQKALRGKALFVNLCAGCTTCGPTHGPNRTQAASATSALD